MSVDIVQHHVDRVPAIIGAALQASRRRAADVSQGLSRKGAMRAAAERCNLAVQRLIELAYQRDECGLCNVDHDTGVFYRRFSVPWSTRNYGRFALLRTEADVLALHMRRLSDAPALPPLFTYDAQTKRWGLNIFDYPKMESAVAYWKQCELTARGYHNLMHEVSTKRAGAPPGG